MDDENKRASSLPPGYHAQPAGAFQDERAFCEFNRVYGPPVRGDKRGPISHLDEDLSYWEITWEVSRPGDKRKPSEWLQYRAARKPPYSRLTFEQFSSISHARQHLEEFLNHGASE